ncbi:MAG: CBS domain-containing protein [Thermoanaerobaculia bacterium]|nr:CBS domain-containing protein [Thermoanaerobaculia bacterium]
MLVRDALIEDPLTARPDESLGDFLPRVMASRQATAAVLGDEGQLLGLVGVHDLLRKIVPVYLDLDFKLADVVHPGYLEERAPRLRRVLVKDLMTTKVDSVSLGDNLMRVVGLIVEKQRKTLPVLENGKFVGMVTRRTILDKLAPLIIE